jgi:hypothetical protein
MVGISGSLSRRPPPCLSGAARRNIASKYRVSPTCVARDARAMLETCGPAGMGCTFPVTVSSLKQ